MLTVFTQRPPLKSSSHRRKHRSPPLRLRIWRDPYPMVPGGSYTCRQHPRQSASTPSPTSSGCMTTPPGTTCAAYSTSCHRRSAAQLSDAVEIFQHLWTDFFAPSDDEVRRPAPGKGLFHLCQEATAHQTIGWRPGKQTGGTFAAL